MQAENIPEAESSQEWMVGVGVGVGVSVGVCVSASLWLIFLAGCTSSTEVSSEERCVPADVGVKCEL